MESSTMGSKLSGIVVPMTSGADISLTESEAEVIRRLGLTSIRQGGSADVEVCASDVRQGSADRRTPSVIASLTRKGLAETIRATGPGSSGSETWYRLTSDGVSAYGLI